MLRKSRPDNKQTSAVRDRRRISRVILSGAKDLMVFNVLASPPPPFGWTFCLFHQEQPEQEHDQDQDDAGLFPELFLPDEAPEEMSGEIEDDEMINGSHELK
jgi:hypothetical protein